jgi:hypothetical protein
MNISMKKFFASKLSTALILMIAAMAIFAAVYPEIFFG